MLHVAAPCMCYIILDLTENIGIVDIRFKKLFAYNYQRASIQIIYKFIIEV